MNPEYGLISSEPNDTLPFQYGWHALTNPLYRSWNLSRLQTNSVSVAKTENPLFEVQFKLHRNKKAAFHSGNPMKKKWLMWDWQHTPAGTSKESDICHTIKEFWCNGGLWGSRYFEWRNKTGDICLQNDIAKIYFIMDRSDLHLSF